MIATLLPLVFEHIVLVAVSVVVAALVAIPAGIWAYRNPELGRYLLRFADIVQTVPSLALFGLLLPLPLVGGIGARIAIVALFLYALLPILRMTVIGLEQIPTPIRESAIAMGMTSDEILREVELPLAAKTIVGGLRIATVTTIGTATIAAAVGAGGLGVLLYQGLATVETGLLLEGAIPSALLAVVADRVFLWIEDKLSISPPAA